MQIALAIATIVLFILGLWPIALLTLVILVTIAATKSSEQKKNQKIEIEKLKQRVEELERGER